MHEFRANDDALCKLLLLSSDKIEAGKRIACDVEGSFEEVRFLVGEIS